MDASSERIRLLYEIAVSIGTSLDLRAMLRSSLLSFVENLGCSAAGAFHIKNEDGMRKGELLCRVPDKASDATFRAALLKVPDDLAGFHERLPIAGRRGRNSYHILGLPDFGFIVLVKKGGSIDPLIVDSLSPVLSKLATAANACLRSEELRRRDEALEESRRELQNYLSELERYAARLSKKNEELKKSEEDLRLFSRAVEEAPDGIQIVDLDGRVAYSNRAVERIYGYSPEELKGWDVNLMNVDPTFAERVILPSIKKSGQWDGELMVKRKDGREFPIWLSASLVLGVDGGPIAMVGIIRDVTGQKRMEAALRESEEKFRSVAQSAGDPIVCFDGERKIIFWNRMAEAVFGYSSYEAIGEPVSSILPKRLREPFIKALHKALSSGGSDERSIELSGLRKDGSSFPAEFSFSSWKTKTASYYTAIIRDITARRRTENERLLSQGINNVVNLGASFEDALPMAAEAVRALFEYEVCDILLLEGEKRHLRYAALAMNPEARKRIEDMLGIRAAEYRIPLLEGGSLAATVEGRKPHLSADPVKIVADFFDDESIKGLAGKVALLAGVKFALKVPLIAEDEVLGVMGVSGGSPIRKDEVELLERIASQVALVIRKGQLEKVLKESEERFRQIFEQNEDAILMLEPDTCAVLDANPAAVGLFGYEKQELLNGGLSLLKEFRCGEMSPSGSIDRRACSKKDGTSITVSFKNRLIRLRDRDVLYCSFRDVTEKIRLEEEAKLRQAQLIHAGKMSSLGTLVSGVAHEINNPNNFIMFNSPLIFAAWRDALGILDGYYRENGDFSIGGLPFSEMRKIIPKLMNGISEGASRIKDIVENLKDFARQGKDAVNPVDLNAVVRNATALVGNQIRKHTDNFRISLADGPPPVMGDARQLEQVVVNLLLNALDALPGRNCAVEVSTSSEADHAFIRVRDEGTGIQDENIERITEPFFTTKLDRGGTGLGLSISYAIVKEHGGSMEFQSKPGGGTTAAIKLPLKVGGG